MRLILTSIFALTTVIGSTVLAAVAEAGSTRAPSHHVRVSSDGSLSGKISVIDPATGSEIPAADLNVTFMQGGTVKSSAQTDASGLFRAQDLASGGYSVIASGSAGFTAFSLAVSAPDSQLAQPESSLEINARAVPPREVPTVVKLVNAYVPAAARMVRLTSPGRDFAPAESTVGVSKASQKGLTSPESVNAIELQADGKLVGRLCRLSTQSARADRFHRLDVFLVQGEAIAGKSAVYETGTFEFKNVKPGDYSVVAAGPEGFTAFSIRTTKTEADESSTAAKELLISVGGNTTGLANIDGAVVDMANFPEAYRQLTLPLAGPQGAATLNGFASQGSQSLGGGIVTGGSRASGGTIGQSGIATNAVGPGLARSSMLRDGVATRSLIAGTSRTASGGPRGALRLFGNSVPPKSVTDGVDRGTDPGTDRLPGSDQGTDPGTDPVDPPASPDGGDGYPRPR